MPRRAFSMIELVIVVVIAGIIAAIAVPRVTGYAGRARERRVVADQSTLQKSSELFAAEHGGITLAAKPGGGNVTVGTLTRRLVETSLDNGTPDADGIFGPYLRAIPENALNGLATVRMDGAAAGAGTHGWRYDSALNVFHSDEAFETKLPDGSTVDHLGEIKDLLDLGMSL